MSKKLAITAILAVVVLAYVITGGAGRFEGATGSATVNVISWSVTSELSAETGAIVGTFQVP